MDALGKGGVFLFEDFRLVVGANQVGRERSVRYALEGSVQRSGNRLRVNAWLIESERDTQL